MIVFIIVNVTISLESSITGYSVLIASVYTPTHIHTNIRNYGLHKSDFRRPGGNKPEHAWFAWFNKLICWNTELASQSCHLLAIVYWEAGQGWDTNTIQFVDYQQNHSAISKLRFQLLPIHKNVHIVTISHSTASVQIFCVTHTNIKSNILKTSIDVLPSKHQVLCKHSVLKTCKYLHWSDCICSKSCDKALITKGHIVMHRYLNCIFKSAVH